jgi:hypothetical protein
MSNAESPCLPKEEDFRNSCPDNVPSTQPPHSDEHLAILDGLSLQQVSFFFRIKQRRARGSEAGNRRQPKTMTSRMFPHEWAVSCKKPTKASEVSLRETRQFRMSG